MPSEWGRTTASLAWESLATDLPLVLAIAVVTSIVRQKQSDPILR